MKELNTKTLMAIAGIAILAILAAYYGGLFAVTAGGDCEDGGLFVGETLGAESSCTYVEVTVEQFDITGTEVLVSQNTGGILQSFIYVSGETKTFTIDGCDETWTVECEAIFANSAWFEICYDYPPASPVTCADPTPNHASGRALLEFWDTNNDHIMSHAEQVEATIAYLRTDGIDPTLEEWDFTTNVVDDDYESYSIDDKCPVSSPVPCDGLSTCNSDLSIFYECCAGDVWSCSWNNYDGAGYRVQWQLWESCGDWDCVCDGAASHQTCDCVSPPPPVTCEDSTPNHASGRALLEFWDTNNDHIMSYDEQVDANVAYLWTDGIDPTLEEVQFIMKVVNNDCVPYSIDDKCPVSTPPDIDDATDTLTFDKTAYQLGDTVTMTAWGKNVGGETWNGKVSFTITQPNGAVYATIEQDGIYVIAGRSKTVSANFPLPATGQSGTWTAQSRWITDDGVIDARSSILDIGEGELKTDSMWIIGGIAALAILLYFAFRKKQPKR